MSLYAITKVTIKVIAGPHLVVNFLTMPLPPLPQGEASTPPTCGAQARTHKNGPKAWAVHPKLEPAKDLNPRLRITNALLYPELHRRNILVSKIIIAKGGVIVKHTVEEKS